jgi:anthranilate synthase/aminodeoxychorismate synthase-like glutamine amidotransferase
MSLVLLLDNYDSFTWNLYDYILQTGRSCRVVRNDAVTLQELKEIPFSSIVMSPGPETPAKAGIMMDVINEFHAQFPMLGICLGHQAIGTYFGAGLVKAIKPMHGKTSSIHHNGHPLFKNISNPFTAMRYHSLVLEQMDNTPLQVVAHTDENEVMAIVHPTYNIAGVQFHPESVLSENGLQLLRNWFVLAGC